MPVKFNAESQKSLKQAAKLRRQSLLISGHRGSGLSSAAKYFAETLKATTIDIKPVDRATGAIDTEGGKITVQIVRDLQDLTRTKTTHPQVVIIHNAERMTAQAQNAFLKLLEEPREGLHFALLCENINNLLPTVLSRLTQIHMRDISSSQSSSLLDDLGVDDPQKRRQILFIAGGLPDYIERLSKDEDFFKSEAELVSSAKQLLQADTYNNLVAIATYKDDRKLAIDLVDKALLIARRSLKANPSEQLTSKISALLQAKDKLLANGNVRLSLMVSVL